MNKNYNYCWWLDLGYPGEYVYGDDVYVDDWYMDERWLPITGLSDRYWVSTHGRVWSVLEDCFIYGSPLKSGYIDLSLRDYDGKRIHRYMHRLVAEAFIPNPHNYPEVLHGPDDDPSNNCVWNLRWGTQTHNMQDAIERGRFRYFTDEDRELAMQKRRMPITAYNLRNGKTIDFASQYEAARSLGIRQGDISAVLSGKRRMSHGWSFVVHGEKIPSVHNIDIHYHSKLPLIRAIHIDTGEEHIFRGLTDASRKLGVSIASISLILHGKIRKPKTWYFEYIDEGEFNE